MFHLFLLSLSGSSGDTLLTTSPCSILQLTECAGLGRGLMRAHWHCALIKPLPSRSCGDSRDQGGLIGVLNKQPSVIMFNYIYIEALSPCSQSLCEAWPPCSHSLCEV